MQPTVKIRNITMQSLDTDGAVVGSHTVLGAEAAAAIQLTLDVPSPATGTGAALVLDGHDGALVRAAVVDVHGVLVSQSVAPITFSVVSGPGRLTGVGNGNNTCHTTPTSDSIPVYAGLARGVFQVTIDCTSAQRELLVSVDVDQAGVTVLTGPCPTNITTIIVRATSPGLSSATLAIPISGSPERDTPLAVAGRPLTNYTYLASFVG